MLYSSKIEKWIIVIIAINILICMILSCIVISKKIPLKSFTNLEKNSKKNPMFSISFNKNNQSNEKITIGEWLIITEQKGLLLVSYKYHILKINKWRNKQFYINSNKEKYTYKYLTKNSVAYNEECNEGYKKCGLLDTMNNILCLENDEECPINLLTITNNSDVPIEFLQYSNYSMLDFEDGSYLFYTNEAINNHIIVEFTLSGNKPCMDLEMCQKAYNGNIYDDRYFVVDEIDQYTFYEQNNLINKDVTFIQKEGIKSIKLFNRGFLGFDLSCIDENFFLFKNLSTKWNSSKYLIILSLILYFGIILYILFFYPAKEMSCSTFLYDDSPIKYSILKFICISLPGFFTLGAYLLIKKNPTLGCGDELTEDMIMEIIPKKDAIKNLDLTVLIFNCINIAIIIIDDLYYKVSNVLFFKPIYAGEQTETKKEMIRYIQTSTNDDTNERTSLNEYSMKVPVGIVLYQKKYKEKSNGCVN